MPRKYNVEYSEKNPFESNKLPEDEVTFDWVFEERAYGVKRDSINKFDDTLTTMVKNRDIISYVSFGCCVDIPNIVDNIDRELVYLYMALFTRMVKASKVVQDLSIQGNYIEAEALNRGNFERGILIEYFTRHPEMLSEFMQAKSTNNIKILKTKYSIKNMVENTGRNYQAYQEMCDYVHANPHEEDFWFLDLGENEVGVNEAWINMQAYNEFDEQQFLHINRFNNNYLIEIFDVIFRYLRSKLRDDKVPVKMQKAFEMTKQIEFLDIREKE